ncbi:MAG: DoxX family protein [Vicinamibacterales bacterium]
MSTVTVDITDPGVRRLSATDWALRAGVALFFCVFAAEKLVGSNWNELFAAIGLGQWFRYFTGAVQLAGALLLLVPRTARIGGALIASTMLGAMVMHVAVLETGVGGAIIPAALLPLVVAAAWKGRGEVVEESALTLR